MIAKLKAIVSSALSLADTVCKFAFLLAGMLFTVVASVVLATWAVKALLAAPVAALVILGVAGLLVLRGAVLIWGNLKDMELDDIVSLATAYLFSGWAFVALWVRDWLFKKTTLSILLVLSLSLPAMAGGKTPGPDTTHKNTTGKGHENHQGNGFGHHKGDKNDKPAKPDCGKPDKPDRPGRPGRPAGGTSNSSASQTQGQQQAQAAVGIGVGVGVGGAGGAGYGGSAVANGGAGGSATGGTGIGGNSAASTGPVNATNSIQGVQGGSATVNVTTGQPGASGAVSIDNGDSVWLPQVWRPNAWVTPWCPQVYPVEGVGPMEPTLADPLAERPLGFTWGGKRFVLED